MGETVGFLARRTAAHAHDVDVALAALRAYAEAAIAARPTVVPVLNRGEALAVAIRKHRASVSDVTAWRGEAAQQLRRWPLADAAGADSYLAALPPPDRRLLQSLLETKRVG